MVIKVLRCVISLFMFLSNLVDIKYMRALLKYLDTIDKKAFAVTIVLVACFLVYISVYGGQGIVNGIKRIAGKSHETSGSPDIFCAKKENSKTAFCSDRRAATNEQWKEVASSSSGKGRKAVFNLRR